MWVDMASEVKRGVVGSSQAEQFEALSGVEQILLRPGMWIGSMQPVRQDLLLLGEDGASVRTVEWIPAFLKIVSEILDNSVDALVRFCGARGRVKVVMEDGWVYVEDDGPGIPVVKKGLESLTDSRMSEEERRRVSETWLPEIAWTRLFSGSNFRDSDDKTTVGSHGLGSKCTSIFSKRFVGVSDDGKRLCRVVAKDNLGSVSTEVSESKGHGCRVKFVPDFARFGLEKVDEVYRQLVRQRLLCLGTTFPGIRFSFNGRVVNLTDRQFLGLFSKDMVCQTFDRGFIGVYPSQTDEFGFFTYVNGLAMLRGGSHVDWVCQQLVGPIRERLARKWKAMKPADVKNRLSLVVFLRDFPNLRFDSQTKETLTNLPSEVSRYFGDSVDFDRLAKAVMRSSAIMDPIVETFRLKEEVKERVALKQAGRSRAKVSADKWISPTGGRKEHFLICEGLSAQVGLAQALGRQGNGYYAGRGVPLNVWDCKVSAMLKNREFSDITTLLGIDPSRSDNVNLEFDRVVMANDADADGIHIQALYLGWWMKFCPGLFAQNRIARLRTPLVVLWEDQRRTRMHRAFYSLAEYKAWEATHDASRHPRNYFKGLGSWSPEQFQRLFDSSPHGLDDFLQYFHVGEDGQVLLDEWLNSDRAESRRQCLREYTLDIESV